MSAGTDGDQIKDGPPRQSSSVVQDSGGTDGWGNDNAYGDYGGEDDDAWGDYGDDDDEYNLKNVALPDMKKKNTSYFGK